MQSYYRVPIALYLTCTSGPPVPNHQPTNNSPAQLLSIATMCISSLLQAQQHVAVPACRRRHSAAQALLIGCAPKINPKRARNSSSPWKKQPSVTGNARRLFLWCISADGGKPPRGCGWRVCFFDGKHEPQRSWLGEDIWSGSLRDMATLSNTQTKAPATLSTSRNTSSLNSRDTRISTPSRTSSNISFTTYHTQSLHLLSNA